MRTFAILNMHSDMHDNAISLAAQTMKYGNTVLFTTADLCSNSEKDGNSCIKVQIPDACDSEPKIRNWINSYLKQNNAHGFVHVLQDDVVVESDISTFLTCIETAMEKLDYNVWFNTIKDPCNYVYNKYNPRLSISLDTLDTNALGVGSKLLFASHSNTTWICYDFDRVPDDLLKFDEDFTIPMFFIIEFLARRRNTKKQGQLYYMNQYMTVESEYKAFSTLDREKDNISQESMQKEDMLFKQKEIDYHPNNIIDEILNDVYLKIDSVQ